ncbi:MAG: hypothetical protein KGI71_05400 [Patescibacteria group bacterium]|nr:hypothetical protein [Patescibacteria group bacterium]
MSFPLVSRRAYDLVLQQLATAEQRHAQALADFRLELEAARQQSATLTETLCRMKVAGAEPVRYGHESLPPPKDADPVKAAIREQVRLSGGDPSLDAHLRQYARQLKLEGKTPDAIALAVGTWESSEDLSAPQDSLVPVEVS